MQYAQFVTNSVLSKLLLTQSQVLTVAYSEPCQPPKVEFLQEY